MKKLMIVMSLVTTLSFYGCTSDKPKIRLDLSDYTEADGGEGLSLWQTQQLPAFYKDASCKEEIKYEEDLNEQSIDYYLEEDVTDVYLRLPVLIQPVPVDEQTIKVKDGKAEENEYIHIESISVGELGVENWFYATEPYSIQIVTENQEVLPMTMYYHVNDEVMETTYFDYNDDQTKKFYHVELRKEDQSLIEEATITFDTMGQLFYPQKEQFSSENVQIHFVEN